MNHLKSKWACLLLAFCLLIGLAGCGTGEQAMDPTVSQTETALSGALSPSASESQTEGETSGTEQLETQTWAPHPEQTETAASPSSSPPPTTRPETVKSTAFLSITCYTAVAKGYHKQANFRDAIPADGVIFSADSVSMEEDETVMALLKRTMAENGIAVSVKRTYVRGIGGLFEKACGPSSGWMYRVNGTFPTVACSEYRLLPGDRVEFLYTCEQGDI